MAASGAEDIRSTPRMLDMANAAGGWHATCRSQSSSSLSRPNPLLLASALFTDLKTPCGA